ncbi:MraY family glycosyltransferase [Halalkalibacter hemicellulosilyticus]|uniref:Undecaprenyl-phosphate N-acetylglucosaminyl 1-phosphate transferase n=1 Tax=Halalkalibacter hemicellulosilyticusJCM 9152 TaxID=1236971 RepID=W4QKW7_9BACI|nr:MraY family glycosyltransferase [Halalkalibacter hemicellulosilyticus]GAE32770.1 undecaprenyl-phosphate N-acetylglucosaminyl 1-phosphate transferase [Halalkalibacter hemicellulosilyticusJCM 9152]
MLIFLFAFLVSLSVSACSVPAVRALSKRYGFVDKVGARKVHQYEMPRLGGVAIVLGVIAGLLIIRPEHEHFLSIAIGASMIVTIGMLDDKYTLNAKTKLIWQLVAAAIVVLSGLHIPYMTLPFLGEVELGVIGYVLSIVWIVGITNSINFIDGLDGLAGGVVAIAFMTILVMSLFDLGASSLFVLSIAVVFIGSIIGFLFFNVYPASIFMGDTGSLFLGYAISVISLVGFFKSVTVFSLVLPIVILAVPISDTLFAIVRRLLNKQSMMTPDKGHLHHCLLAMGYSHRKTVLIVYLFSLLFGVVAIVFTTTTLWVSYLLLAIIIMVIELYAECIGLMGDRKPLLQFVKRIANMKGN